MRPSLERFASDASSELSIATSRRTDSPRRTNPANAATKLAPSRTRSSRKDRRKRVLVYLVGVLLLSCGKSTGQSSEERTAGSSGVAGQAGAGPTEPAAGQAGTVGLTDADRGGGAQLGGRAGEGGARPAAGGPGGEAGRIEATAGSAGSGMSTAGSAAGPQLDCPADRADCDQDPVNGCEADTTSDPNHCGGCGMTCDGWCHSSECTPFEVLATGQYDGRSITFFGNDAYWTSSADPDVNADKYQLQKGPKAGGSNPATLLGNHGYFLGRIAAGGQWLYFTHGYDSVLYKMRFDGSDAAIEQSYAVAASILFADERIHWVEDYANATYLYSHDEFGGAITTHYSFRTSASEPENQTIGGVTIDAFDRLIYAVMTDVGGAAQSYDIMRGDAPDAEVLTTGAGSAYDLAYGGDLYWVETQNGGIANRLLRLSSAEPSNYPWVVQEGCSIYSLAVADTSSGSVAYFSWYDPNSRERGLSVYEAERRRTTAILLGYGVRSLAIDGVYLYFFENKNARLVRLPLPHTL
jgi:hypothetical protein